MSGTLFSYDPESTRMYQDCFTPVMADNTQPSMVMPLSSNFYTLSKMLVEFAQEDANYQTSVEMLPVDETSRQELTVSCITANEKPDLLVPSSPSTSPLEEFLGLESIEKDGPKGNRSGVQTLTLRTLDHKLFVYKHGNIVEKGLRQYLHVAGSQLTILRLVPHETPSLIPEESDEPRDEVDLTLVLQGSPNPSDPVEVAKLENKKYGLTLALDLTEFADPKLIALSDTQLIERMKKTKSDQTINPLIKIRYTSSKPPMSKQGEEVNNIAFYFETIEYYYYVHVEKSGLDLTLKRVVKSSAPAKQNFIYHLQFFQKEVINVSDEIDYSESPEILSSKDDMSLPNGTDDLVHVLPKLNIGSHSEDCTPVQPKLEPHRFLSDPGSQSSPGSAVTSKLLGHVAAVKSEENGDDSSTDHQEPTMNGIGGKDDEEIQHVEQNGVSSKELS